MRRVVLMLTFAGAVTSISARHGAAQSTMCRPVEDVAVQAREYFARIVGATDSATSALRDSTLLQPADSSTVQIVSDSLTCASAAIAYAHTGTSEADPPVYPVWVIRIADTRYVVFSPEHQTGERMDFAIFDKNFVYLRILSG